MGRNPSMPHPLGGGGDVNATNAVDSDDEWEEGITTITRRESSKR